MPSSLQKVNIRWGRLLALSDHLELVLRSAKGVQTIAHFFFSRASYLCVWFPGGFCLIVQLDTVRVE